MFAWRYIALKHRSVCWFTAATVLFLAVFPTHFHLHHLSDATAAHHAHEIVVHAMTDSMEQAHHAEAHIIKAAPDALSERLNGDPMSPLLLVFLLVCVALLSNRAIARPPDQSLSLRRTYAHFAPPLRAPP